MPVGTASLIVKVNVNPSSHIGRNKIGTGRIGPGKIELLEKIAVLGSISAAGRAMGMSYRRAWTLVEEINLIFGKPVASRQIGGKNGGGAILTPFGLTLIERFRAIEEASANACRVHLEALQTEVYKSDSSETPH